MVERIVTDKGFDVSRQIEQLRDEHNESQLADSRRDKAVN